MTEEPIPLSTVLIEEQRALGVGPALSAREAPALAELYAWLHRHEVRRSALCLSGGGLRGAAFGLGLIQGLAKHRLLTRLDYLSTVSVGGWVGGWLSAWIHRVLSRRQDGDGAAAVAEVEAALAAGASGPLDPEPLPIRHLRRSGRSLSPRLGLLETETWTLIASLLRNLLLNWLILLPLIAAFLILPRMGFWMIRQIEQPAFRDPAALGRALAGLYWQAVAAGAIAIAYLLAGRPSLAGVSRLPEKARRQKGFLLFCLLPFAAMSVSASIYWAWLPASTRGETRLEIAPGFSPRVEPWLTFAIFGALMHGLGFLLSRGWVRRPAWREGLVVVASGAAGGVLAWGIAETLLPSPEATLEAAVYEWLAAPALLLFVVVAMAALAGLASHVTGEEDREWLARAAAWILIAVVARVVVVALAVFGPILLLEAKAAAAGVGVLAGIAAVVLCRRRGRREAVALAVAAILFLASLLAALSLATTLALQRLVDAWRPGTAWGTSSGWLESRPLDLLYVIERTPSWASHALLFALLALSLVAGYLIDVNRFSLHAVTRARWVRAWLGAARGGERKPNPFTGFDPADDPEMAALARNRPFHVVNVALERDRESFTISPLHCGNLRLGYRDSRRYGLRRDGSRALSLGEALATSGAAAGPAGGRSSPLVDFLLAFFNLRLGRWQGNPGIAGAATWDSPGPRLAGRSLFDETFGLTGDANPYVYLSDGSRFEGLGLYEMVLRRVSFVILSAGRDSSSGCRDLEDALMKIRLDLGAPIRFDRIAPGFALGRIGYSAIDGPEAEDGLILCFEPSLDVTEPLDVGRCADAGAEAQFESDRALGRQAMETALAGLPEGAGFEELFARLSSAPLPR